MTGLDANVLVRCLVRDDPAQAARAERALEGGERFVIDGVVLCALVWVLESGYGFGRDDVTMTLDRSLKDLAGFRLP